MKCKILRPYYVYRKELTENSVKKIVFKDQKKTELYHSLIQEKINRVNKVLKF